ncbi:MAG: VOC family protein [Nanoarchaeota archaeon]
MKDFKVHPKTRIGHIHLSVSNLKRSIEFYTNVLGFKIMCWWEDKTAVFLSASDYHHHIALNVWYSKGTKPPSTGHIGMFHFAILYPSRKEFAKAVKHVIDTGIPVAAQDHGASESVYLADPDGNGIELYADKPKRKWPKDKKGNLILYSKPLKVQDILKELEK